MLKEKSLMKDHASFLKHHSGESAVLFGVSAGGLAALDVAAKGPDQAKAPITGDAPIDSASLLGATGP